MQYQNKENWQFCITPLRNLTAQKAFAVKITAPFLILQLNDLSIQLHPSLPFQWHNGQCFFLQ